MSSAFSREQLHGSPRLPVPRRGSICRERPYYLPSQLFVNNAFAAVSFTSYGSVRQTIRSDTLTRESSHLSVVDTRPRMTPCNFAST